MIVLDSSFLIAVYNTKDVHHQQAQLAHDAFLAGQWGKGLLLEYVFIETTHLLKRKVSAPIAIHAGTFFRRAREVDFIPCSDLFGLVWQEFQLDVTSPLSFVDTAIAQVARQRAGGKVLTFNKAFRGLPGIVVEPS